MTIGTGGVKLEDRVLDLGLNVLDTEATHIYVKSQQPTTYAEATTTYVCGYKNFGAGAGFGSPGAWTSGRKVSSVAITDGTITTTGTVACWSAVDAANSRLHAAGDLTGGGAVTAGQAFSLTSFDVQMMRAPSLDSATTAWISAIGAPAPSSAQQTRVDNLIKNLKAHGLWTVLDRLWLFAGENQTNQATTDIKGLALGTNHGMTLANNGYLG